MLSKTRIKEIGYIPFFLLLLFLLDPLSKALYVGYILVAYIIVFKKKSFFKNLDFESAIILFFVLSYSPLDYIYNPEGGLQLVLARAIFPLLFYVFGKLLISKKNSDEDTFILLVILSVAFSVSAMATVFNDIIKGGFSQVSREFDSIWGHTTVLATGLSSYLIYNTSFVIFIISSNLKVGLLKKLFLTVIFVLTLLCTFRLGSRTLIALTGLSLFVGVVFQLLNLTLAKKVKFIVQIAIVLVGIFYFILFNLDSEVFSTLGYRLTEGDTSSASSAGGRTELWAAAFDKLFTHPFGWQSNHYGHNMWLDTAKVGGVISMVLLIVFTFKSIGNTYRLIIHPKISLHIRLFLGLFTFTSLIFFFSEPILEGNFYVFIFFCLQQGIIKKIL